MVAPAKRSRDEFQAFYTNCDFITSYMTSLLDISSKKNLLEPSAGDGAFIDQVLTDGFDGKIKAYEMNPESVLKLKEKYDQVPNVNIELKDFVFLNSSEKYDCIIANPPYGAYQTPEKRKQLKSMFPTVYAKETYGLFLVKSLEMLTKEGKLVFIIPDTYLTLHMHEGLRKQLVNNYTVESITLFPSKFFPGVNFGYAGLSIIAVKNTKPENNHEIKVYEGIKSQEELPKITRNPEVFETYRISYTDIKNAPSFAFLSKKEEWVTKILISCPTTVGDICSVVTGFYSGNDGKYLRRSETVTRGLKKYQEIKKEEIFESDLKGKKPLGGLVGTRHWVPIVKGGNRRFFKPTEWYMDWSKDAIYDYKVTNKQKARFQNSQYYFCDGIGIPMVSSSTITGAMINGRLFDQSIVGVFPKKGYEDLLWYLLGFFNSKACNILIRTINSSTNNSSNYIKKLPLVIPEEKVFSAVTEEIKRLYGKAKNSEIKSEDLTKMDFLFFQIYEATQSL